MRVMPFGQPWENNYQRQADDAFAQAEDLSANELRALMPPLPQIVWLPDRFGYPTYEDRQPNIFQVFGINRLPSAGIPNALPGMDQKKRVDYSRVQSSDQGSPRNEMVDSLGMGSTGW